MESTVRWRASAEKSGPRSAPSPQKEPQAIRPRRWNSSWPRRIWSSGITVSPVVADTKATFGGAPVYVHMPSATRPTVLIVATTANCSHQLVLASSHFPRLRRIRDPLARRFTLAPMRFLLASHPRVAAPAVYKRRMPHFHGADASFCRRGARRHWHRRDPVSRVRTARESEPGGKRRPAEAADVIARRAPACHA